jgi:DNA recombination protein RmuC
VFNPVFLLAALAALTAAAVAWTVAADRRAADLRKALDEGNADLAQSRAALSIAEQRHAALSAAVEVERRTAAEKLALLAEARDSLTASFTAVSADALAQNNQRFLDLAKEKLGAFQNVAAADLDVRQKAIADLVQPLRESLTKVDSKLHDVDRERATSQAVLTEQLRSLGQAQLALQSETGKLARALRSPNVRGQWGELQLRRVLEATGMFEGTHFEVKETVHGEDGRLTPDVIVRLPGGKNVVVDAKVSLTAFLAALECDDEAQREGKLREHARQVKDHVISLGNKAYWAHFQPAPDIVIMFVPGEALLSAALQHDPGLLEFSMTKGVMLASPLSLMALLRAVAYGWQQETIARNAMEISELGRQLYDRIAKLAEHFEKVGRSLAGAVTAYNGAVGTLETRVLVTARRLKDKGIAGTEELPDVETIDQTPRPLGAPELMGLFDEALDGQFATPASNSRPPVASIE